MTSINDNGHAEVLPPPDMASSEASLDRGGNRQPPQEVESALAAMNTAHNQVSSEISLAQAAADQETLQMQKEAVEMNRLGPAEVEPLMHLVAGLAARRGLKASAGRLPFRCIRDVKLALSATHRSLSGGG